MNISVEQTLVSTNQEAPSTMPKGIVRIDPRPIWTCSIAECACRSGLSREKWTRSTWAT